MTDPKEGPVGFLRLTPQERAQVMRDNPPVVKGFHSLNLYFNWSWKGCGFGQFSIGKNEDGTYSVSDECMGKERSRKLLYAAVDAMLEKVEFDKD